MSVRQRIWWTNGSIRTAWVADYRDNDGKRHIRTFADKEYAEAFHARSRRKRPRINKILPMAWRDPKNVTRAEVLQLCLRLDREADKMKRLIAKMRDQWE